MKMLWNKEPDFGKLSDGADSASTLESSEPVCFTWESD